MGLIERIKNCIRWGMRRWIPPRWFILASTAFAAVLALTSQVFAQESGDALFAELVSGDALITATAETLPGHVYVLNNREVVPELSPDEMDQLFPAAEESPSHSGTMRISATVLPSRLIVVDENDRITEIWSNITGSEYDFYSLRVREHHEQGPEHPLTQGILAQYNRLLSEVDWSERGQVYH